MLPAPARPVHDHNAEVSQRVLCYSCPGDKSRENLVRCKLYALRRPSELEARRVLPRTVPPRHFRWRSERSSHPDLADSVDDLLSPGQIPILLERITEIMERWLQRKTDTSSKTRLLTGRTEVLKDGSVCKDVLRRRFYLDIPNRAHRIALTRALVSEHPLAEARLRFKTRQYKEGVPRRWRGCRFCKAAIEDTIHALFCCPDAPAAVGSLRTQFLHFLRARTSPTTTLPNRNPHDIFQYALAREPLVAALAKFVYDVFAIFESFPIYTPPPEAFDPEHSPDLSDDGACPSDYDEMASEPE